MNIEKMEGDGRNTKKIEVFAFVKVLNVSL